MSCDDRIVLSATCTNHEGVTPGFTNFVVRNVHGGVEFDAHAVGGCVITVREREARQLHSALGEWL